jgi:hypothetical protein
MKEVYVVYDEPENPFYDYNELVAVCDNRQKAEQIVRELGSHAYLLTYAMNAEYNGEGERLYHVRFSNETGKLVSVDLQGDATEYYPIDSFTLICGSLVANDNEILFVLLAKDARSATKKAFKGYKFLKAHPEMFPGWDSKFIANTACHETYMEYPTYDMKTREIVLMEWQK